MYTVKKLILQSFGLVVAFLSRVVLAALVWMIGAQALAMVDHLERYAYLYKALQWERALEKPAVAFLHRNVPSVYGGVDVAPYAIGVGLLVLWILLESERYHLKNLAWRLSESRRTAQATAEFAQAQAELEEKRAKAKVMEEARLRAQADLSAKHEAEVRARVEAEARAKHEAEARARAEAEARARHEAEIRARVEAEARAKHEAELRAKREAELHAKHEAELKARLEAEARAAALAAQAREAKPEAHAAPPAAPAPLSTLAPKLTADHAGMSEREKLLEIYAQTKKTLEEQKKNLSFLAIDVVNSTGMKVGEDAALAERDFRQYKKLVERVITAHKGLKAAWTPDGVMICFASVQNAVGAAQDLIRALEHFNRNVKTIKTDFKVRCGINAGKVMFDDSVRMEEMADRNIDIAGHMQKYAEPNTIYIGAHAIEGMRSEFGFSPAQKQVDGCDVYEWRGDDGDGTPEGAKAAAA